MGQTIFEITADFETLWQLVDELGGDLSDPVVEAAFNDLLGDLTHNLHKKADGYAYAIDDAIAKSDGIATEIKRLQALKKSYDNKASKLKWLLKQAMEQTGDIKFDTELHKFAIQTSGGKQKLDVYVPAVELPLDFQKRTIEPDNDAIRKALESGKAVQGAKLMERSTTLRIR